MPLLTTQSARSFGLGISLLSSNSYEAIQSYTLTGSQSFVEFTNIPQTYKTLLISTFTLSSSFSSGAFLYMNSDTTTSSYYYTSMYSLGSGTGTSTYSNTTISPNFMGGNTSQPGYGNFMIHDYTNTNKFKTWRGFDGAMDGGTNIYSNNIAGVYTSTNAVTALRITPVSNRTWSAGSKITLYGIKG